MATCRAYKELRRLGECEEKAREAALRVFTFHEPRLPTHVASAIVREWTQELRKSSRSDAPESREPWSGRVLAIGKSAMLTS